MAARDEAIEGAEWARCAREALAIAQPEERVECFLRYLKNFPTGPYNRRAAESVERLLTTIADPTKRRSLYTRLRSLRDPHLPPLEPDTWDES